MDRAAAGGRIPIAALANPPALVDLFAETIVEELDFRLEAENMLDVARTLVELDQRGWVDPPAASVAGDPAPVGDGAHGGVPVRRRRGDHRRGIDTTNIIRTGMIGFLEGCMLKGIFHGDLHSGNLLVMADGRTALLDFGITGRLMLGGGWRSCNW